mgnify:CR=1 FL=1
MDKLIKIKLININKDNDSEIKISFSSKYMMDAIKTFNSEEIELSFNGEIKIQVYCNSIDCVNSEK